MTEARRLFMMRLLVGVQGAMLVAIGMLGLDGLIGFASGFGLVMLVLAVLEPWLARMRSAMDHEQGGS